MARDVDLKEIERKAYMSYFQDGLWDTLIGIFLLVWGIGILTDTAGLTGVYFLPTMWIILSLKKRLAYPRIGHVKMAQEKKTLSWLAIAGVVTLLIAIVAYVLTISGNTPNLLKDNFLFLFGVVNAIVVCVIAYWWKVNRWYAYAAIIVAGVASHQWLEISNPFSFIIPGSVILLSGLVVLIRFLRKYPSITEKERDNHVG